MTTMTDQEQKEIFAKNLNHYLNTSGKTQREVADTIGVSPQTFNTWCRAIAFPRMGKVQLLADYFGINKSDLTDKHEYGKYYFDKSAAQMDETAAQMAQRLYDDVHLRKLFDVAKDSKSEYVDMVRDILLALNGKEDPA